MKKFCLLFPLVIGFVFNVCGQNHDISALEPQVKAGIRKAYAASVRIWGFDTIKKAQNSSQFSGVVVSTEGHILTVAHAIQPGRIYKVLFPDGVEVTASALGRIGLPEMQTRPDIGMLKILKTGKWPAVEMGWSYSLKVNQPCISISYPESLNQLFPSVRFGAIVDVLNQWGFVQSSCKMEPGDSGGPLFDITGRVIAMHSRCEQLEDENYEVPIDTYRKYWDALTKAEDYKTLPQQVNEVKTDPFAEKIFSIPGLVKPGIGLSSLAPELKASCVGIKSKLNGIEQQAMGTLFDIKGKTVVVSKSSTVSSDPVVLLNEKALAAQVAIRDAENDLVLLIIKEKIKGGISFSSLNQVSDIKLADLGHFLISVLPGTQKVGVVSSTFFYLPRKFSAGYFGAAANFKDGKVILSRISANSPAADIKLRPGDQIKSINGVPIIKADDYGAELVRYNPGDTVSIQGIREGRDFDLNIILSSRPDGIHPADRFKGGKSIRSDGFREVFAQDGIIESNECGGPVFDSLGRFYGINIARFSRASTIVMPANNVIQFIEKFIK